MVTTKIIKEECISAVVIVGIVFALQCCGSGYGGGIAGAYICGCCEGCRWL